MSPSGFRSEDVGANSDEACVAEFQQHAGPERARTFLHAGHVLVATAPTRITTILGSCVAVCLWHSPSQVGGVNHFLLPDWAASERSARYGNAAIDELFEGMIGAGAAVAELQAKVFGGANVIGPLQRTSGPTLGDRNIELAKQQLAERGVPIVASDVGGDYGRKLIFHTDEGTAWIKRL